VKRVPFLNTDIITGLRQKSRGFGGTGKDWKKLEIPGKTAQKINNLLLQSERECGTMRKMIE
jgi:hypothetical protein